MADVTLEQAQATLDKLKTAMHNQFDYPGSAERLAQFDSHLATVAMVIDHIFDEAGKVSG